MTIYLKTTINGITYTDFLNATIRSSQGQNNSSSSFNINFKNFFGYRKSDFQIGQEVVFYTDKDINPPTTKIFTGLIENINFQGQPNDETINLSGRDYTMRMQDAMVLPEIYSNTEVSLIIKDIMAKYCSSISTANVSATSKIIDYIEFKEKNVYDCVKQLADIVQFIFYVDENKVLNFKSQTAVSSGYTFDSSNVLRSNIRETNQELFNSVRVYGNTYKTGWRDAFLANGGSVFTLTYSPFDILALVGGSPATGGVEGQIDSDASGIQYVVNINDRQVVFLSGDAAGDNIPTSGGSVIFTYNREQPIIKWGRNQASITSYGGVREKVITDNTIVNPSQATLMVNDILNRQSFPRKQGDLDIYSVPYLVAGQTVNVNLSYENIINQIFNILEVTYNFTKANMISNKVLKVRVGEKVRDALDTIKQMYLDIQKIQTQDISTAELLTRIELGGGSVGLRINRWLIETSDTTGVPRYDMGYSYDNNILWDSGTENWIFLKSGGEI